MPRLTKIFGLDYAQVYDAIYREKDYHTEVALIEDIFARNGLVGSKEILDLGCGTGNHTFLLAGHGHSIVGVDRSRYMLAQARKKLGGSSPVIDFFESDIRELDLGKRFDAVLMMFSVLSYQLDDADLMAALAIVRSHLKMGGLFVFDVWNGPAVLAQKPSERWLEAIHGLASVTRRSLGTLNASKHVCRVRFELQHVAPNTQVQKWAEEHVLRYYFFEELYSALRKNDLNLLDFRSFPDNQAPADERAWNAIGVARAK
jgi:SAM-dependent methyltransferase